MNVPLAFIHASVDGHLGCFYILVIVNIDTVLNVDFYERSEGFQSHKKTVAKLVAFYTSIFPPFIFRLSRKFRIFHSSEC